MPLQNLGFGAEVGWLIYHKIVQTIKKKMKAETNDIKLFYRHYQMKGRS